jgi:hypothetical protein
MQKSYVPKQFYHVLDSRAGLVLFLRSISHMIAMLAVISVIIFAVQPAQAGPPSIPGNPGEPGLLAEIEKLEAILSQISIFPGDGQTGPPLRYRDNGDGTITDLNTKLVWEKKVISSHCLHCVDDVYTFSEAQKWINDVNAEEGKGFAGHNDWRLPNVKELESIVDYGQSYPAIDPAMGPMAASSYWSSTSPSFETYAAAEWAVNFYQGTVPFPPLIGETLHVRAVRGPLP